MRVLAFLFILISGLLTPGMMLTAILLWSGCANAQVTSDGTTNTIVNQNGNNFNIIKTIETNRLRLANGAWIQSSTSGNNSITGDITIHATDLDMVGDETSFSLGIVNTIGTFITFGNNNQSGRVAVDAQRIRLLDGDRIT
ncbi:hypothetical protein [Nostoc sp. C117]|uniref:hypothetical protein n=1 Tax=Nostoc sp. C117 TaxID=3349875 RepID=UPI00370DB4F1